jgi:isopropylmalate/homocitrate/citramalate synthase
MFRKAIAHVETWRPYTACYAGTADPAGTGPRMTMRGHPEFAEAVWPPSTGGRPVVRGDPGDRLAAPAGPAVAGVPVDHGLPAAIVISDTTLSGGEQAPGVAFSRPDRLRLAERLAAVGVPLIEAGFPAVSADEAAAVRGIVEAGLGSVVQVVARPLKHDIDMAVESGADSIALFVAASDAHIVRKLRTDREQLLRLVRDSVGYAKKSGRQVVFVAEDATRSDPDFLAGACAVAADSGADAIVLADTLGVATPESMARLVGRLAAGCPLPIAVHCHNDLGLAVANSIAALGAGATGVRCSVLGIGERAGTACLEELALALEVGYGFRTGLDLRALTPLAQQVASLTGQTVQPGRPVVGRNAFLHESGLHAGAVVREPSAYEPYPPELTGRRRAFTVGRRSGRAGVGQILAGHGLTLANSELDALLGEIRRHEYRGEPLREDELLRMVRDLLRGQARNTAAERAHSPAAAADRTASARPRLRTGESR